LAAGQLGAAKPQPRGEESDSTGSRICNPRTARNFCLLPAIERFAEYNTAARVLAIHRSSAMQPIANLHDGVKVQEMPS